MRYQPPPADCRLGERVWHQIAGGVQAALAAACTESCAEPADLVGEPCFGPEGFFERCVF
jgi:hypothetical protein